MENTNQIQEIAQPSVISIPAIVPNSKRNLSFSRIFILLLFSLAVILFIVLPLVYSFATFTNPEYNGYEDFGPLVMIMAVIFANIAVFPITVFLLLRFEENLHGEKLLATFAITESIIITVGIFTILSPFILLKIF